MFVPGLQTRKRRPTTMHICSSRALPIIAGLLKRGEVAKGFLANPTRITAHGFWRTFLTPLLFLVVCLAATDLRADTITGTVQDPSGAVVAGARIEITGGNLPQPIVLTSDASGKFSVPDLAAGKYSVRVTKEGFEDLVTTIDLQGTTELPLKLTIATQQTEVRVSEKSLAFANSDPFYRQLRGLGLGAAFRCDNFSLPADVGTFQLQSGTITFLAPVNGYVTGAIFIGQGHFVLKP